MKYIKEINNILEFEAWSGGDDRLKDIEKYNLEDYVTDYLDMISDDEPMSNTNINDWLWFESDDCIRELIEDNNRYYFDNLDDDEYLEMCKRYDAESK